MVIRISNQPDASPKVIVDTAIDQNRAKLSNEYPQVVEQESFQVEVAANPALSISISVTHLKLDCGSKTHTHIPALVYIDLPYNNGPMIEKKSASAHKNKISIRNRLKGS